MRAQNSLKVYPTYIRKLLKYNLYFGIFTSFDDSAKEHTTLLV